MIRASGIFFFVAIWILVHGATPSQAAPHVTRAWINGKVLKVRDASSGSDPFDFENFMVVKVKRDEQAAYIGDENGGTVIPGPGCVTVAGEDTSAGRPEDLYFPIYGQFYTVKCPFTDLRKVDINAGPGNDSVQVLLSPIPVKIVGGAGDDDLEYWSCFPPPYFATCNINGGLGNDYIVGGGGDDVLSGSRGDDYIEGACGSDRMSSGTGYDEVFAIDADWCDNNCPPTTDRITCGGGGTGFAVTDGADIASPNCVQ
jgi:Ca2+-binding RTX toxin-like protein